FEDSPVEVAARIALNGMGEEDLALVIRDEAGKVIASQKARAVAGAATQVIQVRFRPSGKGVLFFRATVVRAALAGLIDKPDALAGAADEATLENNTRIFAVDRKGGPYRVLYVSGRPNWEYKFLRRALETDDEVKLVSLIRIAKREPKFQWRGRGGEE